MTSREITTSSFSFRSAISQKRHDVFLSFRGEDTRHGLTAELHRALSNAGIPTFKDDENLEKGRHIASELLKAIQTSRVSVIVFSKNYATSGWCLDELVKIVECSEVDGQVIVPIFCDVDAEDVFRQKGSFESAFRRHEERVSGTYGGTENKVAKWRSALMEASSSSPAWDLHNNPCGWRRTKFIDEIVKQISVRRQDAHMCITLQPKIVDNGKESLNLLLSAVSKDVLTIGIYGGDKLAKTSIAKSAYNQNFLRFEGSSFLANVSANAKQPNGLMRLQRQLLSDILMNDDDQDDDNVRIEDVNKGIDLIKFTLQSRRVLVVLDNVDQLEQLNALARRRDWFGAGSRVIITTGDANLLSILESDDIYGPKGIRILKDKYQQNLDMIEDLKGVIQKLHFQAQERERSIIAEIERERMKNKHQAKILAELQRDQIQIPSTTSDEIALSCPADDDFEFDPSCLSNIESMIQKEMENLNRLFGDETTEQKLCIDNESGDSLETEVETNALTVLPGY